MTICQFKVQTATAENEKQDTLTNMISVQFQSCDLFLCCLLCSRACLDIVKFHKKYQQCDSLFCQSCRLLICKFTKNAFLSKYFPRFSLRVVIYQTLKIFLEHLFPRKTWLWQLTVVRFSHYSFPQNLRRLAFRVRV